MLNAIVGIEITISRIEAKWKVSQNQSRANQISVTQHLKEHSGGDSLRMAKEINQRTKP